MNLDTPLAEVAHTLPAFTAERLLPLPTPRAMGILTAVRTVVTQWEVQGVTMDPVAFSVVIDSVVALLMELEQLVWEKP